MTPEETALVFQALGIDRNTTIYIASGEIYQEEKRMADLASAYPNLVSRMKYLSQFIPWLILIIVCCFFLCEIG